MGLYREEQCKKWPFQLKEATPSLSVFHLFNSDLEESGLTGKPPPPPTPPTPRPHLQGILKSWESEDRSFSPLKTKSGIRISNKDPKQKYTAWRRCRPWLTHTDYSDGRTGEALALFPEWGATRCIPILKGTPWPGAAPCDQPSFRPLLNTIHYQNIPVLCPIVKHRSQARGLRTTGSIASPLKKKYVQVL